MPQRPTIRLTTPAGILDALPTLLGYSPVGSLVAIPLSGKHGGVVLRFDLPDVRNDPHAFAHSVIEHLVRLNGIERVAVIFAPAEELALPHFGSRITLPFEVFASALQVHLDIAGIEPVATLWRTPDAWGAYGCPDGCHPAQVPTSTVDRAVWPEPRSVRERTEIVRGGGQATAAYQQALTDAEATSPGATLTPLELSDVSADALARLTLRLRTEGELRATLTEIAFGPAAPLADAATEYAPVLPEAVEGAFDQARVRAAQTTLRHLVAHLGDTSSDRVNALSALVWLAWSDGVSSRALEYHRQIVEGGGVASATANTAARMAGESISPRWLGLPNTWLQRPGPNSNEENIHD